LGRLEQAEQAVRIARTVGSKQSLGETLMTRAELTLEAGWPDAARTDLSEVLSIARATGYRLIEVDARSVLAHVRLRLQDQVSADADAQLALRLGEALGYIAGQRRAIRALEAIHRG
jgi:hypothetical protein